MKMNAIKLAISLFVAALAYGPAQGLAVPILGADLASFAVLGGSGVTNVPTSTIFGNVGTWESGGANAITGFGTPSPGNAVANSQVTGGLVHFGTDTADGFPNAEAAQGQLTTARTTILGVGTLGSGTLLPVDLTGLTIFPGVYTVPAGTTNLSGAVTLDGQGNPNAFWLFQMDTLITFVGSVVNVIATGAGAGMLWNVGSSATINTSSTFEGNILALTNISMGATVTLGCGRALADVAAVTLIMDTISIGCAGTGESNGLSGTGLDFVGGQVVIAAGQPGAGTVVSVPGTFVPEPGTLMLLGFGLAGLFASRKRLFPVA